MNILLFYWLKSIFQNDVKLFFTDAVICPLIREFGIVEDNVYRMSVPCSNFSSVSFISVIFINFNKSIQMLFFKPDIFFRTNPGQRIKTNPSVCIHRKSSLFRKMSQHTGNKLPQCFFICTVQNNVDFFMAFRTYLFSEKAMFSATTYH